MNRFSDFSNEGGPLCGKKVKIESVLDKEICILNYKIKQSNFSKNKSGMYAIIQFTIEDSERMVLNTGSDILIELIEKYKEQIPFLTTIKEIDRYYIFT